MSISVFLYCSIKSDINYWFLSKMSFIVIYFFFISIVWCLKCALWQQDDIVDIVGIVTIRGTMKTTRGRNRRKFSSDEQLPPAAANMQLRQMHKARSSNHLACRKRFHTFVIRALQTANKENCCWLSCHEQISLVPARSVIRWKMRGLA